jgi:hypothetical protein
MIDKASLVKGCNRACNLILWACVSCWRKLRDHSGIHPFKNVIVHSIKTLHHIFHNFPDVGGDELHSFVVGVYMQAMITRGMLDAYLYTWMRAHTHVYMVLYGRRTDHGLKYLFIEDTGSGSVPLP